MIPGLTPEEARDLMLSVGTHHGKRKLSPVEVAETFQKALQAGATKQKCAAFVRLAGPTMVSRFLCLLRLSSVIRHTVDWGQTGATMAFASAWRLGELNEDEQEAAATVIMANQMGKEEVRQIIQLRKRSRRSIQDCMEEVLRMRPHLTRKHVFLGAVIDEVVRRWLSGLRQEQRDELFAGVLAAVYGMLPDTSGRLGVERFTIVASEAGALSLKSNSGPEFELAINGALAKRMPVQ